MTFNRDEEERCVKTPSLTFAAFTKPLTVNDKGKLKEVEEERKEKGTEWEGIDLNEQALVLRTERSNAR